MSNLVPIVFTESPTYLAEHAMFYESDSASVLFYDDRDALEVYAFQDKDFLTIAEITSLAVAVAYTDGYCIRAEYSWDASRQSSGDIFGQCVSDQGYAISCYLVTASGSAGSQYLSFKSYYGNLRNPENPVPQDGD